MVNFQGEQGRVGTCTKLHKRQTGSAHCFGIIFDRSIWGVPHLDACHSKISIDNSYKFGTVEKLLK